MISQVLQPCIETLCVQLLKLCSGLYFAGALNTGIFCQQPMGSTHVGRETRLCLYFKVLQMLSVLFVLVLTFFFLSSLNLCVCLD